jgi:very-short-patch-repair endonuclease
VSACTCQHVRSDHRAGVGRCLRASCTCLFGPPPARRQRLPRPRAEGVGHTDGSGIVQDFQRVVRDSERTKLERSLGRKIAEAHLPEPQTQYLWARPERMYRADFAWPERMVLAEVQGGIWAANPGRHNRGSGYERDCERDNLAAILGFRLLRFTERMIRDGMAVDHIRRALEASAATTHQLALTGGIAADAS